MIIEFIGKKKKVIEIIAFIILTVLFQTGCSHGNRQEYESDSSIPIILKNNLWELKNQEMELARLSMGKYSNRVLKVATKDFDGDFTKIANDSYRIGFYRKIYEMTIGIEGCWFGNEDQSREYEKGEIDAVNELNSIDLDYVETKKRFDEIYYE